jgi:hypothetical protein
MFFDASNLPLPDDGYDDDACIVTTPTSVDVALKNGNEGRTYSLCLVEGACRGPGHSR